MEKKDKKIFSEEFFIFRKHSEKEVLILRFSCNLLDVNYFGVDGF